MVILVHHAVAMVTTGFSVDSARRYSLGDRYAPAKPADPAEPFHRI